MRKRPGDGSCFFPEAVFCRVQYCFAGSVCKKPASSCGRAEGADRKGLVKGNTVSFFPFPGKKGQRGSPSGHEGAQAVPGRSAFFPDVSRRAGPFQQPHNAGQIPDTDRYPVENTVF